MSHSHLRAALTAGLLLSVSMVFSQAPVIPATQSDSALPFNFVPPGARATAMGGAFVGIADDATASEANPALALVPGQTLSTKRW